MKLKSAACLAMVVGLVLVWAWPAETARSGSQIEWYAYDKGMMKARESGKGMVFYFYADWCTYCVRMQEETFSHDSVIDFMNNEVIPVKVDVDQEKKISRAFGVRGLPATVLVTRSGDKIGPMPGFMKPKMYLARLSQYLTQD
jgi:thioredoxin-related protein